MNRALFAEGEEFLCSGNGSPNSPIDGRGNREQLSRHVLRGATPERLD